METVGESSSVSPVSTSGDKPVVVRVKRKLCQSVVDAFWLEISEPPSKRVALDLAKLSVGDSATGNGDEPKTRKVLVQHVETIRTSESTISVVQSFVPYSADVVKPKIVNEERKRVFKSVNKHEQILSKSRLSQEEIAKTARFRQIWSSRKEKEDGLHDMCNFYDVVRLDAEEVSREAKQKEVLPMADQKLLSSYLPFLRELIPNAAEEIEAEIGTSTSQEADDFVYDYYTVGDSMDVVHEDISFSLPLVQVEEDDFYDGPEDESEYGSEDSNAENHPFNEYPDESLEEGDELHSEDKSSADDDDDDDEEEEEKEEDDDIDDESHCLQNFEDMRCEDRNDDLFGDYLDEAYSFDYDSSDSERE